MTFTDFIPPENARMKLADAHDQGQRERAIAMVVVIEALLDAIDPDG